MNKYTLPKKSASKEKTNNLCYSGAINSNMNSTKEFLTQSKNTKLTIEQSIENNKFVEKGSVKHIVSKLNLKNLKPFELNEEVDTQMSTRDKFDKDKIFIPPQPLTTRSGVRFNTSKQDSLINFKHSINGVSVNPPSTTGSSTNINDEGKQKVASICNQIKLNNNTNLRGTKKKLTTTSMKYINTKQILSTLGTIGTARNTSKNNIKDALIAISEHQDFENAKARKANLLNQNHILTNGNLTTRNKYSSLSINDDSKKKLNKNSLLSCNTIQLNPNNLHPDNISGNVISSNKLIKVEKKKSTNLSEYQQNINKIIGKNKPCTQPKNTNTSNSNVNSSNTTNSITVSTKNSNLISVHIIIIYNIVIIQILSTNSWLNT